MSTNFWELLQQHQGDLTKSGRTVAEYLVQHAASLQIQCSPQTRLPSLISLGSLLSLSASTPQLL